MRTWARATNLTLCGGPCRGSIPVGAPMLEIRIASIAKTYRRCEKCAGEPAPADLAPLQAKPLREGLPFARFSAAILPLDFKQKASGQ